ncbi:hypothetical protein LLG39_14815, partial [bacterium]|nr:hypothetical protein [bacterium]
KLKQDWESYAFSAWLLAGRPKFDTVDVYPVLFYGCRRFRDDDGAVGHRMKGILDGLKTHLVQDDNSELLTLHTAEMLIDKSYPRLELHIVGRK